MSETRSVIIRGVTIMKGDIVKIKFRKLEDILVDKSVYCRKQEIIEHYQISGHMNSLIQGIGHFIVKDIAGNENEDHFKLSSTRTAKLQQKSPSPFSGFGVAPHTSTSKSTVISEAIPEIVVEDHNESGDWWTLNDVLIEEISVENDVSESYFSEEHQLSLVLIDSTLYINGAPITGADSKIFEMFEKVLADAAINRALNVNFNGFSKKELDF